MSGESDCDLMNAATIVLLRSVRSEWQVLLGQNEVRNSLRSTKTHDVIMRYPGEWKFPGGVIEAGDASLRDTAVRELTEEFLGILPPPITAPRLLNTKITLPVKGKRYRMHNFVVFDDEGMWDDNMISVINENLAERRQKFEERVSDGSYWTMSQEEKCSLSPEIRRVSWIKLPTAVRMMASSMTIPLVHVDDWQRDEFEQYGVLARDPMFQSMTVLEEIAALGSAEAIKSRANIFEQQSMDTALNA